MTDLLALKARALAAAQCDKNLLFEVWRGTGREPWETFPDDVSELADAHAWTDAALALIGHVLPGWGWSVGSPLGNAGFWASVWRKGFSISESGEVWREVEGRGFQPVKRATKSYRPTPALALVSALLAALIAQEQNDGR